MINWTTTTFEANPIATDLVGQTYAYVQDTRKAVGERLRVEHDMDDTHGTSGQGVHTMGSARAFIVDHATASPPVSPALPVYVLADGPTKGRIAFKRYDTTLDGAPKTFYRTFFYYKDGTASPIDAWVEPSYVHLDDVDETMYGLKTFFDWPVVKDITGIGAGDPYDGHSDSTLVPVGSLKRALLDYTATIQDAVIPVGFLYVQYPGFVAPTAMWPWATWEYSTAATAFNGAFFRAEGTDASNYGSGVQPQQLLSHAHTITYGDVDANSITNDQSDGGEIDHDTVGDDHRIDALPTSTDVFPDVASTENRPKNVTIRIWRRTA